MNFEQARKRVFPLALAFIFWMAKNGRAEAAGSSVWVEKKYQYEDLGKADPQSVFPTTQTLANRSTGRVVLLRSIHFAVTTNRFAVIDNPRGDETLAAALQRCGALAGVNGGYFHPDRTPLGLEISGGQLVHSFERARLLSGLLAIGASRTALLRVSEFSPRQKLNDALQAGPFLIDQEKAVTGLNDVRRAQRTAICFSKASGKEGDVADVFRLIVCEPVTLAEFAQILTTQLRTGTHTVERALNLDGGSSTGMWIRGRDTSDIGDPKVNVRNYLAILPR